MGQNVTQLAFGGKLYKEIRDDVSNALIRRIPLPVEQQPLKARLRLELEDAIDDLQRMKFALDYAEAKGDVAPAAIADGRVLEGQLYTRMKQVFQEWRSA